MGTSPRQSPGTSLYSHTLFLSYIAEVCEKERNGHGVENAVPYICVLQKKSVKKNIR